MCGLLAGHVAGLLRMVLDFLFPLPECGFPDVRPSIVRNVHYTYFGQLVFLLTLVVAVLVSLVTKPRTTEQVFITIKTYAALHYTTLY